MIATLTAKIPGYIGHLDLFRKLSKILDAMAMK